MKCIQNLILVVPIAVFNEHFGPGCVRKMSQWMTDCFLGKLAKVKKHVTKNHRILDRRETPLRINGLMYAVVGYKLGVNNPQRLAVIKYLIKKGTPVDGRDFVGHTALHQGPDSIEIRLLEFYRI